MSKSLRLSEKWFSRGLWLIAVVFACFLTGLGSAVVGDLPQVEGTLELEQFMDPAATAEARGIQQRATEAQEVAEAAAEQAQLKREAARQASESNRETFDNWLATRKATQLPAQDAELIARTRNLDTLKTAEIAAQREVDAQQQALLDARQSAGAAQKNLDGLERAAAQQLEVATRAAELRVFGYRLALTLPLLALAGWLFARKRKSVWWPFVWGFIFFALFAFFVELVPYLPSYGGYVRYAVGIVITVAVGRYAVTALARYRERQALAEQMPDTVRREELSYDSALARLAKGVCPGCERPVDLKSPGIDFCPHCGIGLYDHCVRCTTRKSAFSRFCHACGAPGRLLPGADSAGGNVGTRPPPDLAPPPAT